MAVLPSTVPIKNALTPPMLGQVMDAIARFDQDDDVRVLLFSAPAAPSRQDPSGICPAKSLSRSSVRLHLFRRNS